MKRRLLVALAVLAVGLTAAPLSATPNVPEVADWAKTPNMTALGFSPRLVPLTGTGSGVFNSDLAFWGDWAIQGHYAGFRIIDISKPSRPKEIVNYTDCVAPTVTTGSQGDIVVYGNILVRAWDAPAPAGGRACGEVTVPQGQEGSVVFDISDPTNPVAKAFVNVQGCGSHTITGVPDPANNRLIIYSNSSQAGACAGIHVMQVPLDNLAGASLLRLEPSGDAFAGGALVNLVDVASGGAAGTYAASGSQWHPDPTPTGVTAPLVLVNAGPNPEFPAALPSEGCGPLLGFPAGAIALVDRGTCPFLLKAQIAEAAGASAVIVLNNTGGNPTTMAGDSHSQTIPTVMISQANGALLKANLPTTGTVRRHPDAINIARFCHDTGVILGDVMKIACAGGNGVTAWTIDPAEGGSLEDPKFLWSYNHGTSIGHTAAFTYDGKYIVFGHEPGGGGQAQCQASSSEFNKTIWFLDSETGKDVGHFVMPRPQTATENCTWHNVNVIPLKNKGGKPRYVFASGNYQSGISVVDFTDVHNPEEIAYVDPPPLSPTQLIGGGDWSTYWYNGRLYQSDMKRGLFIWSLDDPRVGTFYKTAYSNPQTLEFSIANSGPVMGGH